MDLHLRLAHPNSDVDQATDQSQQSRLNEIKKCCKKKGFPNVNHHRIIKNKKSQNPDDTKVINKSKNRKLKPEMVSEGQECKQSKQNVQKNKNMKNAKIGKGNSLNVSIKLE